MMTSERLITALYEWQSPTDMALRVEQLGTLLGDDAMQRRGRAYREAWVAARFAKSAGYDLVRLLRESNDGATPDLEVRSGTDLSRRYETTEADIPGRRRQAEYRDPRPKGIEPMVFTSLTVMVEQMRKISAAKAAKTYDDCSGLIIHLNPPMFSFEPQFRTAQMREATEPAADAFREVWLLREHGALLWKEGVYQGYIPDDF